MSLEFKPCHYSFYAKESHCLQYNSCFFYWSHQYQYFLWHQSWESCCTITYILHIIKIRILISLSCMIFNNVHLSRGSDIPFPRKCHRIFLDMTITTTTCILFKYLEIKVSQTYSLSSSTFLNSLWRIPF